jgi:hypothetical protein
MYVFEIKGSERPKSFTDYSVLKHLIYNKNGLVSRYVLQNCLAGNTHIVTWLEKRLNLSYVPF